MGEEPTIFIRIDDRLEEYRPLFDQGWAQRIGAFAAETRLSELVRALITDWKAAAATSAMPWLTVHTLKQQWAMFQERQQPFALRLTADLAQRLADEMGDALSHAKRRKLSEAVERLGIEAHQQPGVASGIYDTQTLWSGLLDQPEFQLAVWGSQRLAYGSIYHCYEHFVRQCIGVALGSPEYKAHKVRVLARDAARLFGKRLADDCLSSQQVRIARLVRNALAHNGGRETEQLRAMPHGLAVEEGVLQIMARDTRSLFELLKRRAYRLVKKAVTLPMRRDLL